MTVHPPPHDERAHFLAKRKTHVVCCSLRPGHRIVGTEPMSEAEANTKVEQFIKQTAGKVRYWTEKVS